MFVLRFWFHRLRCQCLYIKKKKKVGGENKIGVRIKYWFCWPLMSVMKSHERLVLGFRYIIVLLISFLYYENGFLYKGLTFKSKKDP